MKSPSQKLQKKYILTLNSHRRPRQPSIRPTAHQHVISSSEQRPEHHRTEILRALPRRLGIQEDRERLGVRRVLV